MMIMREQGAAKRASFVFFLLFVLLECLSIAAANVALGFSVFFIVIHLIKNLRGGLSQEIKTNLAIYKKWIFIFFLFWLGILISALLSGDISKGLRIFFGQYVYRTVPFFLLIIFFARSKLASLVLFVALFSCAIDVLGGLVLHPDAIRLKGLYGHPMTLAGFLTIGIPVLFCLLMDWHQKWNNLFTLAIFFFVAFVGLLLNGTRGAWLAVLVAVPVSSLFVDFSLKKAFFLLSLLLATALIFLDSPRLQNRAQSITSTTLQSNTERVLMWNSAIKMFKDYPITGVGLGQYTHRYQTEYISSEAKERSQNHAHNNLIQMLAENGIVGFSAFIAFFGFIFVTSLVALFKKKKKYGAVIFGCTLAFFLQGLTEFNFGNSAVIKYYWVVLGSLVILLNENEKLLPFLYFLNNRKG